MSFVWNGVSSDTMKFNVTSRQVYNAPAYDLNAIEVPGRSGDLLNPQNRFKNKQVTYTGFLKASDFEGSTWREKLSTGLIQLKGWLCSDAGQYHELTDDYDPGFTRYGYISGETAISDIEDRPFGVTLTVTFNCKPFMYKAGEPMELPETKSASGSIITITDGAENTPLKSAIVNIEPVQDLHGYDYPWPAGGGVNQLPAPADTTQTSNGITCTAKNGIYTVSGTSTATAEFIFDLPADVTLDANTQKIAFLNTAANTNVYVFFRQGYTNVHNWQMDPANRVTTWTAATTETVNKVRILVSSGATVSMTISPMLMLKTQPDPTTFAPYSNICPISGWSQVDGVHTGDNAVFPSDFEQGSLSGSGTPSSSAIRIRSKYVEVEPNTTYAFKIGDGLSLYEFHEYGALPNRSFIKYTTINDDNGTVTTSATTHLVRLLLRYPNNAIVTPSALKAIRMCKGDNADYTPITIALGQTVYGGTLDLVRGKLVIDRAYGNISQAYQANWGKSSSYPGGFYIGMSTLATVLGLPPLKSQTPFICSHAKTATVLAEYLPGTCFCDNSCNIRIMQAADTVNDWRAYLQAQATAGTPVQACFMLATPQEYDVIPQTIKTLLGTNNIWADAGKMSIEYPIPTENPYPFGSRPLYEITMAGTGTLVVNGKEWTITDYTGTLYCDTEAMEWYDASQLRNNIVSGDGWPVFEAGENSVSYTGDITKVMVTPRWRTL